MALVKQLGSGAVALFFMVTGLLFYGKILDLSARSWAKMLVGRVFRIIPLTLVSFSLVVAVVVARTGLIPNGSVLKAVPFWLSGWKELDFLGHPNTGRINAYVLWSLKQEWFFYIATIPLLAVIARGFNVAKLPTIGVPITFAALAFAIEIAGFRTAPVIYWPLFAAGMLAAEVRHIPRVAELLRAPAMALASSAALFASMVFARDPYGLAIFPFALFFAAVACGNSMGGILTARAVRALGECSFGIYLMHGIVLSVTFSDLRIAPNFTFLPILAAVSVALSATMYLAVEKPFDVLGHRLRNRMFGARPQVGRAPAFGLSRSR